MTRQKKDPLDHIKQRKFGASVPRSTDRSIVCPIDRSLDPRRTPRARDDDGNDGHDVGNKRIKIFPFVYVAVDARDRSGCGRARGTNVDSFERPPRELSREREHHPRPPRGLVFDESQTEKNTHTHIDRNEWNHPGWIDLIPPDDSTTTTTTRRDANDVPWPAPARRLPRIHLQRERAWIGGTRASASRRRKRNERQTWSSASCAELCRARWVSRIGSF